MKRIIRLLAGVLLPLLTVVVMLSSGQVLDPSIDKPDEPFCYFSKPTDMIGVMDGREGTLVSPEWIHDGAVIAVRRAPTTVGEVNFELRCRAAGATLTLSNTFSGGPERLILHFPWFMKVSKVSLEGKQVSVNEGSLELPIAAHRVEIRWSRIAGTPPMSYHKLVEDYKAEYRRRYEASLH